MARVYNPCLHRLETGATELLQWPVMTARFVILHHRLAGGEHWDLMLEKDGKLATWQLPRPLTGPADLPMPARRIGDHRPDYLTYEGPVSGNRGVVKRLDFGEYELNSEIPSQWQIRLMGRRVTLQVRISPLSGDRWIIEADSPKLETA